MRSKFVSFALVAVAALLLGQPASADGDDFFIQDDGGPPVLQYSGHVRDAAGKPIGGASIFVEVKHPRVFVNTKSFPDGGYKAPDVGLYIDQIGSEIDYSQLQIRCVKDGYITEHVKVPDKQKGAVPLDIVLTPEKP
jgi:hypothetical protein